MEESRPEPDALAQGVEPVERLFLSLARSLAVPFNGLLPILGNTETRFIGSAEIIKRIRVAVIGALAEILDRLAIVLRQAIAPHGSRAARFQPVPSLSRKLPQIPRATKYQALRYSLTLRDDFIIRRKASVNHGRHAIRRHHLRIATLCLPTSFLLVTREFGKSLVGQIGRPNAIEFRRESVANL
jgi:hypothetical protein